MKKIILAITTFITGYQLVNAQTNTPPLPNGETKIGEHLHVGAGNEVWTDAANLYFNYRGNAVATHFWNKNGSTGSSVLSILNNGNVGIGTTNPLKSLHITKNVANGVGASLLLQNENYATNIGAETEILLCHLTDNSVPYRFAKIHTVGANIYGSVDRLSIGIAESSTTYTDMLTIKNNGNVGIGTTNPQYKLAVEGTIAAREVKVTAETWSDFVFHPTYKLRTLGEVEQFIKANSHLPEIPTAAEVKENGVSLGEMNAKLLQKVEELTLYLIEQQKQLKEVKMQNEKLAKEIENLKK